jgi:hypothetical protein
MSCQTAQERSMALVADRAGKLRGLSRWTPTWCRVEARLTQPALARYREMFPDDKDQLDKDTFAYTWKSRKTSCEIMPLETSALIKNHQAFLETAFCMLLQTHWVNSPFDELPVNPNELSEKDSKVHIPAAKDPELGLFVDAKEVKIETKTKNHGVLSAVYAQVDQDWLPQRLEQKSGGKRLVVDGLEYESVPLGGRRIPKTFWISVGEDKAFQHTQVTLSGCRNF